ncbi:MAG: glycine cleavage system protein GcvH [Propionibacteriaceae bacterium]|nr:glycine cleavage system protein GcvH [Propionibacteriaceae bacterium]
MTILPNDLRYTTEHEWVRVTGTVARVGVTQHATQTLGDIVYVSLPTVGAQVIAGDACAELESTKSVSDVYAPVGGVVATVNESVTDAPESINLDPYDAGWLFDIEMDDVNLPDNLLTSGDYSSLLEALDS